MKTCSRKTASMVLILLFTLQLAGCGVIDTVKSLAGRTPVEEELIAAIPVFEENAFNRFHFTMDITAGNMDGDAKESTLSGVVETYKDISHLYNLDGDVPDEVKTESWSRFSEPVRYQNQGGWVTADVKDDQALKKFTDALNIRNTDLILTRNDSVCTLSWSFPIDAKTLFGPFLDGYTDSDSLSGSGRVTAVFDPESLAFEHFTIIVSAGNREKTGALLDAVFYWDTINSRTEGLKIPDEVSADAYKAATGVDSIGYNEAVNPIAEDLVKTYGGTAEVTHYPEGAMLFWTAAEDGVSVVANYASDASAKTRFSESAVLLASVYGTPVEETENGRYFYDDEAKELTYITALDNIYAEIIITGSPEMDQGDLRRPLIAYKSWLGV